MNPPCVSVVLPVYNGEAFVKDAIRSIQEQTFTSWELIILDDGSSDRSLEISQKCAAGDSRLRVYANPHNLGLAKTMNKLVRLARGKYIAVQEQDDISKPERLRLEVDVLDSRPDLGLVSGVAAWVNDEGQVFAHFPGSLFRGVPYPFSKSEMTTYLYTEQCKIVNAACMFPRKILESIPGPFDEKARMSIDWQFFLHVSHLYKIVGIPEILVYVRRGKSHNHLTANKYLQFQEARRCINLSYLIYKNNLNSPINFLLYRKAMSTEFILEGRFWGKSMGVLKLLQAIYYYPLNFKAYTSIFDLVLRKLIKTMNTFRYRVII